MYVSVLRTQGSLRDSNFRANLYIGILRCLDACCLCSYLHLIRNFRRYFPRKRWQSNVQFAVVMRDTEEHEPLSSHGPLRQKVYGKRRVNLLLITTA